MTSEQTDFSREPWFIPGVIETPEAAERNREWVRDYVNGDNWIATEKKFRYFNQDGLHDRAPQPHRYAYENMEDIDSWGTRDLPKGFHM